VVPQVGGVGDGVRGCRNITGQKLIDGAIEQRSKRRIVVGCSLSSWTHGELFLLILEADDFGENFVSFMNL